MQNVGHCISVFAISITIILSAAGVTVQPTVSQAQAQSTTNVITESADVGEIVVPQGNILIIDPGVHVVAYSVLNFGTIINKGVLTVTESSTAHEEPRQVKGSITNDHGTIENHGVLFYEGPLINGGGTIEDRGEMIFLGVWGDDSRNMDGGKIIIREGALWEFSRGGSYKPHNMVNEYGSVIDVYGNATSIDAAFIHHMTMENHGVLYIECGAQYSVPTIGDPIIDKCKQQVYPLTVETVTSSGSPVTGIWTTIRNGTDGAIVKTGFTPLIFNSNSTGKYDVTVANYDGKIFQRWQDTGDGNMTRTLSLNSNMTIAAVYTVPAIMRFTPFEMHLGPSGGPQFGIDARTTNGERILNMWTLVDLEGISPYVYIAHVTATDGYQNLKFDHWDNGSTDRFKVVKIEESQTITAYYREG